MGWTRFTRAPPFQNSVASPAAIAEAPSGQAELAGLEQAPTDERKAVALSEALLARARVDMGFERELESWWGKASQYIPARVM